MKKLFDGRFLFIVIMGLIMLIVLGVGSYYLFDDSDDVFVKSGYVINPLSPKVEKYFFNEDVSYKENLSSMVVFKDVDDNDASVLRDSFLHYNDNSLSFLKNGAILDLDSINGSEAVKFYNITSKSIVNKSNDGYVIKNSNDDIKLKNFIGRISDDKYIVVGKLEAKFPGNEKNISGDYFEIVYAENGIVNIENKDVKYQVAADGTIIYAGDVVIDLGNKKITRNGEDIMSITAITINGDENIEIIPTASDEEDSSGNDGNTGENGGANGNGNENGGGVGDNSNGNGSGNGEGGTGETNVDVEKKEETVVSLKEAAIGSTNVDVTFDIYNQAEDDSFTLKVTNLDTGRTIDMITSVSAEEEIRVNLLSPGTKYLFTVINEKDGNKYFQKIFETKDFGIKLEKAYATDDEIAYRVSVGKDTDITNAKLTLYQFNEETGKNEVVTTSYYDTESETTKYVDRTVELNSSVDGITGVHEIVFDGLSSDTIYTAVLDEFSMVSSNFKDVYNITLTSMTLKQTPQFSDMKVSKNVGAGSFKLSLDNITDPDNAIESYTYLIYENSDPGKTVIDPIVKSNASPIEVTIGDKENQLKNDVNYFYKVVIEYYDNEKYVEYIMDDTINFVMGSDPYVTVVTNNDMISYDRFSAKVYLTDNSCLIAMPDREKCSGEDTTRIIVSTINAGGSFVVYDKIVKFDVTDDEIMYDLSVNGLQAGTTYTVKVLAVRGDKIDEGTVEIAHTDESKKTITTKTLTNFVSKWEDETSSANHVINLKSQLIPAVGSGTMSPDESARSISSVVLKLYKGSYLENLQGQQPIAVKKFTNTDEFNIKSNFYDDGYVITSDETFGLSLADLKAKGDDGKLSEYYTIAMYAYYDSSETNEVVINNNVTTYKISPILLMENVEEPKIFVTPIENINSGLVTNLQNERTPVGYKITAYYDNEGLVQNGIIPDFMNIYVYNSSGKRVSFYVDDGTDNLVPVSEIHTELNDSDYEDFKIYMGYGSDYSVASDVMNRGERYYIGYEITAKDETLYPINVNKNVPSDYGLFDSVNPEKETPTVKMYIAKSTADSITYRYNIFDPDKAIYMEGSGRSFYYTVNDGTEKRLELTQTLDNTYAGDFVLAGLNNNDTYSIYYKKNTLKTGNIGEDISTFSDGDNAYRIFDGYYDANSNAYNFKYDVINNPLVDNKVTIKILASAEMLKRVVNYRVNFVDSKSNELTVDFGDWELTTCNTSDEDDDKLPRCYSVDYNLLKNAGMKSDSNNVNVIRAYVTAFYDNGLTGYDFLVGDGKEYQYMIMQTNLTTEEEAKYISFSKNGEITVWNSNLEVSKGYYNYSLLSKSISYQSKTGNNYSSTIRYSLSSTGYVTNYGVLNPKMISVVPLAAVNNSFSFSSITPKVSIGKVTKLINGAIVNLSLSGADMEDFCEEGNGNTCVNNADSDFYVYIDVWNNLEYVGNLEQTVRPTVKVKINKNAPNAELSAVVDLLNNATTYYYNVYTYLNKNDRKVYSQIFHAGYEDRYEVKTYSFTSLSSGDLYHNFDLNYKPDYAGEYNDKIINTKINLIAYENGTPFNFDLAYAFCETSDANCGVREDNTNIYSSTLSKSSFGTVITDTKNISNYDLEFNKDYYMNIYVIFDYYEPFTGEVVKNYLQINRRDVMVNLKKLETPEFIVSREASLIDNDYVIDFTINVRDSDKVLLDGEYFVKLIDSDNNVVGDLQIKDEDNYVTVASNGDYANYSFDADVSNQKIRIKNLNVDTKYTIVVYGRAYINNYDVNVPKNQRTVDITKTHTVYSVNNSGVAFGKDLLFSATEKSIVVTFLGGSHFGDVRTVNYTIGLWDNDEDTSTYSGSYAINSESNKKFEMYEDTGDWRFVIDPDGMNNVLGQTYTVALGFEVVDSTTNERYYFDSITNPEFAGRTQYVKDNK